MRVLLLLALTIVSVASETCTGTDISSCTITNCGSGGLLECVNGLCTCTTDCDPDNDLSKCKNLSNCQDDFDNGFFQCDCQRENLHCIDGTCHCGYPPN